MLPETVGLNEFVKHIMHLQEQILKLRTNSAVSVLNDKKNARIEADKYIYGLIDLLGHLDREFRMNEPIQDLAKRVRVISTGEREEEPTERELKTRARVKHLMKNQRKRKKK